MRFFRESLGVTPVTCLEEIEAWDDDAGRRQLHDHLYFGGPVHDRTGNWLNAMECTEPMPSGFARF